MSHNLGGLDPRRDITPLIDEPLNRLLVAINHYVSTGTHIGEGVATRPDADGVCWIYIPVCTSRTQDVSDFAAFRSRLDELAETYGIRMRYMGEGAEVTGRADMEIWAFSIRPDQMDALAADLRERPGPLGWGSMKSLIDQRGF